MSDPEDADFHDERRQRLRGLHVLADDDPRWPHDPLAQARAACAAGAAVVQLRTKHATDTATCALAREITKLTRAGNALCLVNDRFDLALAAEADGVHLGQQDLSPTRLPAAARRRLLIGRSTHTLDEVAAACREPIDYVAFGPIFGTPSKETGFTPRGLAMLQDVVGRVAPLPVVAIGGFDPDRARAAIAAGAAGIAVISAVAGAADPEAAAAELVAACEPDAGAPLR